MPYWDETPIWQGKNDELLDIYSDIFSDPNKIKKLQNKLLY